LPISADLLSAHIAQFNIHTHALSRHEQVLLEQLVAEKEWQRRIQNKSHLQLPLCDKVIPASEESRHRTLEPLDPRWLLG
jgi:hypothetical protein